MNKSYIYIYVYAHACKHIHTYTYTLSLSLTHISFRRKSEIVSFVEDEIRKYHV